MAIKIFIAEGDIGGTLERIKAVHAKVAADLEKQINDSEHDGIVAFTAHETDHQFKLIAAVEVPEKVPETPEVEG